MKAWEIIGWTFDGAMYHAECKPEHKPNQDEPCPIFASDEIEPLDHCDTCLAAYLHNDAWKTDETGKRVFYPVTGHGTHVYLDTERAEEEISRRTEEENASA